jgi:hypothetical protein
VDALLAHLDLKVIEAGPQPGERVSELVAG